MLGEEKYKTMISRISYCEFLHCEMTYNELIFQVPFGRVVYPPSQTTIGSSYLLIYLLSLSGVEEDRCVGDERTPPNHCSPPNHETIESPLSPIYIKLFVYCLFLPLGKRSV